MFPKPGSLQPFTGRPRSCRLLVKPVRSLESMTQRASYRIFLLPGRTNASWIRHVHDTRAHTTSCQPGRPAIIFKNLLTICLPSSQTNVDWSSSILLVSPWLSISLPSMIALLFFGRVACQARHQGTSRAFGIFALKMSGNYKIHHACLTSGARLNSSIFRNPNPPWYSGLVITSRKSQLVFCSPRRRPHQILRMIVAKHFSKEMRTY